MKEKFLTAIETANTEILITKVVKLEEGEPPMKYAMEVSDVDPTMTPPTAVKEGAVIILESGVEVYLDEGGDEATRYTNLNNAKNAMLRHYSEATVTKTFETIEKLTKGDENV